MSNNNHVYNFILVMFLYKQTSKKINKAVIHDNIKKDTLKRTPPSRPTYRPIKPTINVLNKGKSNTKIYIQCNL